MIKLAAYLQRKGCRKVPGHLAAMHRRQKPLTCYQAGIVLWFVK